MKWKMISHSEFQMDEAGYHVDLNVHGSFYPIWTIVKDGFIVDNAMRHSPVTSDCNKELAAKAQIERILTKLISENSKTLELVK